MLRNPPTLILFPYTTLFRSISDTELHFDVSADLLNVSTEQWVNIDVATPGLGSSGIGSVHIVNDSFRLSTTTRSEEHTSELQSRQYLVCRLLLEKKHTKVKN